MSKNEKIYDEIVIKKCAEKPERNCKKKKQQTLEECKGKRNCSVKTRKVIIISFFLEKRNILFSAIANVKQTKIRINLIKIKPKFMLINSFKLN